MSAGSARLVLGPGGGRVQAVFMCACGSLEIAARGMCPRCLARQHHDLEYFGGFRQQVLERDCWTCQGCFYRPEQKDRDYIVVHHRVPGVSKPELMISLCAACHAIVERLQAVRSWLPPQLYILWREQHGDVPAQLQLPLVHVGAGPEEFNPRVVELDL
jgi:hypothetical protein